MSNGINKPEQINKDSQKQPKHRWIPIFFLFLFLTFLLLCIKLKYIYALTYPRSLCQALRSPCITLLRFPGQPALWRQDIFGLHSPPWLDMGPWTITRFKKCTVGLGPKLYHKKDVNGSYMLQAYRVTNSMSSRSQAGTNWGMGYGSTTRL